MGVRDRQIRRNAVTAAAGLAGMVAVLAYARFGPSLPKKAALFTTFLFVTFACTFVVPSLVLVIFLLGTTASKMARRLRGRAAEVDTDGVAKALGAERKGNVRSRGGYFGAMGTAEERRRIDKEDTGGAPPDRRQD